MIRDTTFFDFQEKITNQLDISTIDITRGTFGTGDTEGQTILINLAIRLPTSSVLTTPIAMTGGSFGTESEGQTTFINLDLTLPTNSVTTIKD